MPTAGPKALASYSLVLTQNASNAPLHLVIVSQKEVSSYPDNQGLDNTLVFYLGKHTLKTTPSTGHSQISGMWKQKTDK